MRIETVDALEAIYGAPNLASTAKVADRITPEYRRLIEASPFLVLATVGPEGLDASPRGDARGLVRLADDRTLLLPDRRGNNRVDSLRNIVRDPRVGLLFLIPGSGTTLRVNGRAHLSIDPDLLASFAVEGAHAAIRRGHRGAGAVLPVRPRCGARRAVGCRPPRPPGSPADAWTHPRRDEPRRNRRRGL
jgi:predicted pyridoxine 5'-phosphate oxidase superfamily flavin-nucleotide-binding protein